MSATQQRVYRPLTGPEITDMILAGFRKELIRSQLEDGKPPEEVGAVMEGVFEDRIELLKLKNPRIASVHLGWPYAGWRVQVKADWKPGVVEVGVQMEIHLNAREVVHDILLRKGFDVPPIEGEEGVEGTLILSWEQKPESAPDKLRQEAGMEVQVLEGPRQAVMGSGAGRVDRSRINAVDLDYTSREKENWEYRGHELPPRMEPVEDVVAEGAEGIAGEEVGGED